MSAKLNYVRSGSGGSFNNVHEGSGGSFNNEHEGSGGIFEDRTHVSSSGRVHAGSGGKIPEHPTLQQYLQMGFDRIRDWFADPSNPFDNSSDAQSAQSIIYSDWSPAARHFGMDQATAYSEHMANTAHQREVADLRAAGLNPVLGISGSGSGSVTGSPAMSGSSSAEKNLNLNGLFDFLGVTAGLIATAKTKNPSTGYMVSRLGDKLGDLFK